MIMIFMIIPSNRVKLDEYNGIHINSVKLIQANWKFVKSR